MHKWSRIKGVPLKCQATVQRWQRRFPLANRSRAKLGLFNFFQTYRPWTTSNWMHCYIR